jgi:hypothetical protein
MRCRRRVPREALDWQKKLEATDADDAGFEKALAKEVRARICANDANAIYILPGTGGRLAETGREAPELVDFIMSKDCPVSASLTDARKAKPRAIKQDAEKEFLPPPAAKQDQ